MIFSVRECYNFVVFQVAGWKIDAELEETRNPREVKVR